jgi:hypothetical protein
MMDDNGKAVATVLAAIFVLTLGGCHGKKPVSSAPIPIIGLSSGMGLSFNISPGGGSLSILYDNAKVEIPGAAAEIPGGTKSQSRRFSLVSAAKGQNFRFFIRGFSKTPANAAAKLEVVAGSKSVDLSASLAQEDYMTCFDATADGSTLDVVWTGTVKQVKGEDSYLTVDSIDISALPPKTVPIKDGNCPALAQK